MAKFGRPFESGEEAFIFTYIPRTSFYLQKAKIIEYIPKEQEYILKATGNPISTMVDSKGYPLDQELKVRSEAIKSETYVKNVLRKWGKDVLKDIFFFLYKRKRR